MADQHASNDLSPALQAVLGSLSVNLEDELNRYRRNRAGSWPSDRFSAGDVFAGLEDAAFEDASDIVSGMDGDTHTSIEVSAGNSALAIPTVALSAASASVSPPPLPPNKKLLAGGPTLNEAAFGVEPSFDRFGGPAIASTGPLATVSVEDDSGLASLPLSGYLASSEKLIESLSEVAPMPDPIDTTLKPKRRTVSLLAGATLGLLGLVAGLGASYLVSNPTMAQKLVGWSSRDQGAIATAKDTFDPPGPDLSAQEFVDVESDNLSSLKMPQTTIDPLSASAPAASAALPPITGQTGAQPGVALPAETQAAIIPAGTNYYVTVPFTTEQGLADVRQSVAEAFVRQFSDGNRVQLAAVESPEAAQQLIEELKAKGITAQVYGPTAE
ncbi:MAG: hypothetical protein WBA76_04535 [Phormidesmis sp.]